MTKKATAVFETVPISHSGTSPFVQRIIALRFLNFHALTQARVKHIFKVVGCQYLLENSSRIRVAMYQIQTFQAGLGGLSILQQEILPGVRREPADGSHFSSQLVFFPIDAHDRFAICNSPTQSIGRLPGDDHNSVALIFDIIFQVMQLIGN